MLSQFGNALSAVGNVLDTPGAAARAALVWKNPFDALKHPLTGEDRVAGRDVLRHYGLAGQDDTWGNFAAGLGAEAILDPLNFVSGSGIAKALRARSAAKTANKGIAAANAKSLAQRMQGFMPEEIVDTIHPVLKETSTGLPKRVYHGTYAEPFETYGKTSDIGYHFGTQGQANKMAGKMPYLSDIPEHARINMHYIDAKNPLFLPDLGDWHPQNIYKAIERTTGHSADNYLDAVKKQLSSDYAAAKAVGDKEAMRKVREASWRNPHDVVKDFIQSLGHDSVAYRNVGEASRYATPQARTMSYIALDPSQVYKPYLAARLRDELPVRSLPYLPTALAGIHNALARQHGGQR